MVSSDEFGGMIKLHGKEPQSFLVSTCISRPVDKVEKLVVMPSPIHLRVEDFFNLVFNFSINLDQRQWRLDSIQNGAQVGEFKLGDMVKTSSLPILFFGGSGGQGMV